MKNGFIPNIHFKKKTCLRFVDILANHPKRKIYSLESQSIFLLIVKYIMSSEERSLTSNKTEQTCIQRTQDIQRTE